MIDNSNDYLKSLAIKLLLITPHNVTCKGTFSMLGFLYDKRRQNLNLSTIEMMVKIQYYLFLNIKKELNYSMKETENDLKILLDKCDFFNKDEKDEVNNDDFFDNSNEELLEILLHEVQVLIINNFVDLSNSVFTREFEETNNYSSNEDGENDENLDDELDFEVITKISAPLNM